METKRLFVGGLYNDIKEVDLRDRFKTFGTVSSVEIIRRTDEKGFPLKTFAYVDILQTESDYRKCVSLLTNSKWKGCCLKIQAAKESFLTRLERERQQKDQASILLPLQDTQNVTEANKEQEKQKQNAIPETLPKAVPGTPLQGKKNWVVGKFGRVLPVVYLRRRDRKKIAKFDPSKTTHCLKKIKPEELSTAVSELTWNLESEKEMANGGSGNLLKMKEEKQKKSKLKETDNPKTDFDVNNGIERNAKKTSEDTLSINYGTVPHATHLARLSASIDDDLESDSSASHSESDTDQHSNTKRKRNTLKDTEGNSSDTSHASSSSTPPSSDVSAIAPSNKDSVTVKLDITPQNTTNLLSNIDEVERSSYTKRQNKNNNLTTNLLLNNSGIVQVEDGEHLSDENNSTTSDRKSSDSSDEASDAESSESQDAVKTNRNQLSSKISTRLSNISFDPSNSKELPIRTPKTKDELQVSDNPNKQKHSNEKRLDALQEKKKSVLAQRNLIKDALKDLDSSTPSHDGKKHIVFSDDEEDESGDKIMEKAAYSVGDKISGSKASSWLGLDSDSDDQEVDDGDDQNEQLVTVKPHFEGKAGEELFKLQKTFGGDKRFELDSRFLESEEEDGDHHTDNFGDRGKELVKFDAKKSLSEDYKDIVSKQEEDDISRSLTEEKEMAMKVLSNILGGNFRAEYSGQESQEKVPEFRNSAIVHYDPAREDHKQFEQTTAEETEKKETEPAFHQEKPSEDPVLPEVSKDKYHDVNTSSLAELFGNKEQGASFTFFSQGPVDDDDSAAEERSHVNVGAAEEIKTNPWQSATKLPYDSSDDDDDDDDKDVVGAVDNGIQSSKSTSHLEELFFFHPDDPELANRINDQETPFMRTGSQEEVSEYWVSVRSDLTQDYKRKRKDAVRRQNKLAAKRTRIR
ncbi:uncharacterized protein LOC144655647 [Oculina patagonica]